MFRCILTPRRAALLALLFCFVLGGCAMKNILPGSKGTEVKSPAKTQETRPPRGPAGSVWREDGRPPCVTLALPLSGSYGAIGKKVAAGARAAEREFSAMQLLFVDTADAGWLDRISALPPQCAVVGGPLRREDYVAAKSRGVIQTRALFAFLPSLEGADEGQLAWRFFSSPEDQVTALQSFTHSLGINSYGVLMPNETYGHRMGSLFVRSAEAAGDTVQLASYNRGDDPSRLMASFLGSYVVGKRPLSSAKFQAAFFPDSWKRMESMLPYLFYHGGDRLVLMGTSLWEQPLSGKSRVSVENMDLAVFPGAWDASAETPGALALRNALSNGESSHADSWAALGYDFVRFAAALRVPQNWNARSVNAALSRASLDWSMAPIRWVNGQAHQDLFLFQPKASGMTRLDPRAFAQRLEQIRARYARRARSR